MNRRTFLKIGGSFLVVCAGAGLGPVLLRNRRVFGKSTNLMGTVAEIQVVHDDAHLALLAIEEALEEVKRIERRMSHFNPDSEISLINRSAFENRIDVSEETSLVIGRGLYWSKVTKGEFDPGLGKVVQLWNVKEHSKPPAENLIQPLMNRGLYRHIDLSGDPSTSAIRFTSEDVRIDLGGIAKGYAADRAAAVLANLGIEQALVNLGGDLICLGGKSESEGWKVGIKDPLDPSRITEVLSLRNQAVATSGNYEQYFSYDGHLYHHLIDPRSAHPRPGTFRSLTILADNCRDADALATGLFFANEDETRKTLEDHTNDFRFIRLGT